MEKVLLINMPISSVRFPPLGISLLKAKLSEEKIVCDIFYANIIFAKMIGVDLYNKITQRRDGDIIFGNIFWNNYNVYDKNELKSIIGGEVYHEYKKCTNYVDEFIEKCFDSINWQDYKVVGFSSVYAQNIASFILARKIKKHFPNIVIVFGGSNCYGIAGKTMHKLFPFIDIVFQGESEITFPEVIKRIYKNKGLKGIPNIVSRNINIEEGENISIPHKLNLSTLPIPSYDDWVEQIKRNQLEVNLVIEASRGCWWNKCTFCNTVFLPGNNGFNPKNPEKVFHEFNYLINKFNPGTIQFTDVVIQMKLFNRLISLININSYKSFIRYEIRADLNKSQCIQLKKANINWVQIGVESFSQQLLNKMKKGSTVIQNIQILKWCKEIGIKNVFYNILYAFPDDTDDDYAEMINILPIIVHLPPPAGLTPITITRYSPLYKQFEKDKLHPLSIYNYIYPDVKNNINNLVDYFYHSENSLKKENISKLLHPLIKNWQDHHRKINKYNHLLMKDFIFFLFILDTRTISERKIYFLTGFSRKIYLSCDSIKTKDDIFDLVKNNLFFKKSRTDTILKKLCNNQLIINIKQEYLSLAISPKNVIIRILYLLSPFLLKTGHKLDNYIHFAKRT